MLSHLVKSLLSSSHYSLPLALFLSVFLGLDSSSAIIRVKLPAWVEIDEWILSSLYHLLMILQEGNLSRVVFKRDNNYRKYSQDDNSWDRVLCVLATQTGLYQAWLMIWRDRWMERRSSLMKFHSAFFCCCSFLFMLLWLLPRKIFNQWGMTAHLWVDYLL